jgi:DNA-binding NtrC family response regulator
MYSGRILIVDDDYAMQKLLQAWLQPAGYETIAVSDGEQALNSMSHSIFDLALVDYRMPKMDGLSVLGQIAEHSIPVGGLLLTASHETWLIVEAMRRGAIDCMVKPVPANSLLNILDEAMERHWARQLGLPPLPIWSTHDSSVIAGKPRIPGRPYLASRGETED